MTIYRKLSELSLKFPDRVPRPKTRLEQQKDFDEAALYATLGGDVDPDLLDPPFELRGYRLLSDLNVTYTVQNDGQSAAAGAQVPNNPSVTIVDSGTGRGVPNVPVRFQIVEGGGKVNGDVRAEVLTTAAGVAAVTFAVAGASGAKNTLRATTHGYGYTFTAKVT